MDRNRITGMVLITLLMIVYMFFVNSPEDKKANQIVSDTITLKKGETLQSLGGDSILMAAKPDSELEKEFVEKYGVFASAAKGETKEITLENNEIKVSLSSKGGTVSRALLKKYLTNDKKPLYVVNDTSSLLDLVGTVNSVRANHGKVDFTDLYFTSSEYKKGDTSYVDFKISLSPDKYIVQTYSLAPETYVVNYNIKFFGLDNEIQNLPVEFLWTQKLPKNEIDLEAARTRSTVNYYFASGDFDYLNETSHDEQKATLDKPVKWVSMKQKFFCSAIIAQNSFERGTVQSNVDMNSPASVKDMRADLLIPIGDLKTGKGNFQY
jgi:YidC/Oxa1 family membrane protein insertase